MAAGQCAEVGGAAQGRPRGHAAVQLGADARGPFRRSRGGRDPRGDQQSAGEPRGRVHPQTQRCPIRADRRRARAAHRAAGAVRRHRDPLCRRRRCRRSVRAVPGRRVRREPESWLEDEEETISINYTSGHHWPAEGGAVHIPRRVSECAERGDRRRDEPRVGVPLDAADVSLQRLVLPMGGNRGQRQRTWPCAPSIPTWSGS